VLESLYILYYYILFVIKMRTVIKFATTFFVVLIMLLSIGIGSVSGSTIEKSNDSPEDEVVLTYSENKDDLLEAKAALEDTIDKEAVQAIIAFLESEGEMTLEDIDGILSDYPGWTRFYASGVADPLPNIRWGVTLIAPSITFKRDFQGNGPTVWIKPRGEEKIFPEAPVTLSMTLFVGVYNIYGPDKGGKLLTNGWGLNLEHNNYNGLSISKNIIQQRLQLLFPTLISSINTLLAHYKINTA
jgi:hypothetical protein